MSSSSVQNRSPVYVPLSGRPHRGASQGSLLYLTVFVAMSLLLRPWWSLSPVDGVLVQVSGPTGSSLVLLSEPRLSALPYVCFSCSSDMPLFDGDSVILSDHEARVGAPKNALLWSTPLNLNACDSASLQLLSGIGPALAKRIIQDRDRRGLFTSLEDLQRVRGIGPKTVARLLGRVTLGLNEHQQGDQDD